MIQEIVMPKFGQTMEEGRIVKWLKHEGDFIEEGEIFLEIEGDKSILEVESEYSGQLKKIVAQVDDVLACGEVIANIEVKD
jgi:pyruvate/2-oxoglutarate dehydrogenase complex dihydrolipoamide acyltransferase (E2) component